MNHTGASFPPQTDDNHFNQTALGDYVFQFEAFDGEKNSSDLVTITLTAGNILPDPDPDPNPDEPTENIKLEKFINKFTSENLANGLNLVVNAGAGEIGVDVYNNRRKIKTFRGRKNLHWDLKVAGQYVASGAYIFRLISAIDQVIDRFVVVK